MSDGERIVRFRSVNRAGRPGHDAGLQRHHLVPRQVATRPSLRAMFEAVTGRRDLLDDFRQNGILLPCREQSAIRLGLPLHRGPHRRYNEVVLARVGEFEAAWSRARGRGAAEAAGAARFRLRLLQRALRRMLLGRRRAVLLHAADPFLNQGAFADLDEMAEAIWAGSAG